MKNVRPNAARNFLKRKQYKPEHKAPNRKIEVAINSPHRNSTTYIGINRGSPINPPQRFPRVGKGGVQRTTLAWFRGEGGIRKSRRPRSMVPPQGAIKSTEAMRYSSLKKPKPKIQAKRRYLIPPKQHKQKQNPQTSRQPHVKKSQPQVHHQSADCKSKNRL